MPVLQQTQGLFHKKAYLPIVLNSESLANTPDDKLLHPAKAAPPIIVTEAGIVTDPTRGKSLNINSE